MRRFMLAGIVVASMCQPASSATFIRCKSSKDGVVTITLNAMKKFSSSLNCISGNFVVDLTPCAPNGGFGLSYPTGSASLSGVVKRWQDYGNHLGGVTGNRIDRSSIWFNGGYMSPGDGFHLGWTFTVDRLTGSAILKTFDDKTMETKEGTVDYSCSLAIPKF